MSVLQTSKVLLVYYMGGFIILFSYLTFSGLFLDRDDQRLYWINGDTNTIQFYSLVSGTVTNITTPAGIEPSAVVTYRGRVYYADKIGTAIHVANKTTGADDTIYRNNTGQ